MRIYDKTRRGKNGREYKEATCEETGGENTKLIKEI